MSTYLTYFKIISIIRIHFYKIIKMDGRRRKDNMIERDKFHKRDFLFGAVFGAAFGLVVGREAPDPNHFERKPTPVALQARSDAQVLMKGIRTTMPDCYSNAAPTEVYLDGTGILKARCGETGALFRRYSQPAQQGK